MRRNATALVGLALGALASAGCGAADVEQTAGQWGESVSSREGSFVFDDYEPLADSPVRVYYQAPAEQELADAQILVVMPGVGRNAKEYRQEWADIARVEDALLLVPQFDEDEFPGAAAYNVGNVFDDGELIEPEQWTFPIVQALFEHVVDDIDSSAQDYALFGHSAGAQFVHRMVMLVPDSDIRVAVAANAGWYTLPDDDIPFPYGLAEAPVDEEQLEDAFDIPLVVLLGGDDIDPDDDNLRQDEGAAAQGEHRLERGLTFYAAARETAESIDSDFEWGLRVIPGVAHDSDDMAEAAAQLVFPD